ncbi:MAG: hypothetical protein WBA46_08755 [Thermomicrobiales bacterium]
MTHRLVLRLAVAFSLSLLVLGTSTTLAQNAPRPPATPAASSVAAEGSLTLGSLSTIDTAGQPMTISPDGKWLAGAGPDKDFCIWKVETLEPMCASDRRPMPVQHETVTWAPDSSAVAFSLDAAKLLVDSDIYVMDIDGTLHDLTDDGPNDKISLQGGGSAVPIDMYPAWSPDSTQLVFARTTWGGDSRGTTLAVVDRTGGEVSERFVVSGQEPFIIYSPMHWLDDGSVIFSVLHADTANSQNGVWRLTASGGVERILAGDKTSTVPMPFVNDVSPDGRTATVFSFLLAGQFANDGTPAFFILDLETGETVPVEAANPEPGARIVSAGTFLPDGSSVLSVQMNGGAVSFVLSGLDGTVLGSADLPDQAPPPSTYRGFSIAADGTAFVPTLAGGEAGGRGGLLVTVAGA